MQRNWSHWFSLLTLGLVLSLAEGGRAGVAFTPAASITTTPVAGGIALSPDESKLYVAVWEDANGSRVLEYQLPSLVPIRAFTFGGYHTHGDVVLSAEGDRFFTQNYYYGSVSMVSNLQGTPTRTDLSTIGSWPGEIDITPDKSKVLVMAGRDGRDYDMDNDGIGIYDVAGGNFSLIKFVTLPDEPCSKKLGFSADNRSVYVPTRARKSASPMLYEISLAGSPTVTRSLEIGVTDIWSGGVACAGNTVFVSEAANPGIWQVDRSTWTKTFTPMPSAPATLMMHPDGRHLFALLQEAQAVVAIDIRTMSIVGRFDGLEDYATDIEFGSGGSKLYISHRNMRGTIKVFALAFTRAEDACGGIEDLISNIKAAALGNNNTRPLIASLEAACASFTRGNVTSSVNQLQAFQQKVLAQIARKNPALAEAWILAAQEIIDSLRRLLGSIESRING